MVSSEGLSVRIIFGRALLGSATSLLAGIVLINIPHIHPLALVAIGSGLGIIGQQFIEKALLVKFKTVMRNRRKK
jgi:hypothetical protein